MVVTVLCPSWTGWPIEGALTTPSNMYNVSPTPIHTALSLILHRNVLHLTGAPILSLFCYFALHCNALWALRHCGNLHPSFWGKSLSSVFLHLLRCVVMMMMTRGVSYQIWTPYPSPFMEAHSKREGGVSTPHVKNYVLDFPLYWLLWSTLGYC